MLKLKKISKSFRNGKQKTFVLNDVNVSFGEKEMVFILGRSGSGKSTLLNIMGGLLKCDRGDISFGDVLINRFNDKQMDNYRNQMIGFIFQDYSLIDYMTVYENIKLIQTVGKNNNEMDILLKQLNIYDKKNVLVKKLSGGEKQRVAIARALINNPKIILCDEPTGALDFDNGIKIMDILKNISQNKLVVIVSHDNYLANRYADRIINITDGKINDSKEYNETFRYHTQKRKISIISLIKVALKNLFLKKGRTLLTSLTISLGITCMILVVTLSNSFNNEIDLLEENIVSNYPISIYNGNYYINNDEVKETDKIIIDKNIHNNKIDSNFISYLNNMNGILDITYEYDISMPLISSNYKYIDNNYFKMLPNISNYDVLYGNNIKNIYDIVILVDSNNNVSNEILNSFNIDKDIDYQDIVGKKIRIALNDNYYIESNDYFVVNNDITKLYNNSNVELEIVGVVKEQEDIVDKSYIYYNKELINYVISNNSDSLIVNKQLNSEYNVLGIGTDRKETLAYLGYNTMPYGINIYPNNINGKKEIIDSLKQYKDITYVDTASEAIEVIRDFISIISIVLIIFSIIAIIVSSLMILILTNTRIVERYREIGILRSFGASKKDVIKIFNIENIMIGIVASTISVMFIFLLKKPINIILNSVEGFDNIFKINWALMILVIFINIFIIKLSGYIPLRKASKKEIVDCIYNK